MEMFLTENSRHNTILDGVSKLFLDVVSKLF